MPELYQNQTDTSWGFISFTLNPSHFLVIIAYISSNINPAEQDIDIFKDGRSEKRCATCYGKPEWKQHMSTLERAIEIATEAHKGQFDKSGKDYIGHPLRVMEMGKTEEEKIVGVLHDVVEDTAWTFEALEAEGFSSDIIAALKCVTKTSENENYDDFIERVKKNPLAVAVKINDLTDNMDIRRLPYLSDKDVKRLKKYLKAYKRLTGEPVYSVYAAKQENPNAYEPWTEEADTMLKGMWDEGKSVAEIADYFGRKQSAIITRLKKLGL